MSDQLSKPPIDIGGSDLGPPKPAAIQVICLGSGGGPSEDNVSGFLVRSVASGWIRGSILAVDAGSHMAAITRVLERHLPAISRTGMRADSDGNIFQHQAQSPQRMPADSSPPSSPGIRPTPIALEPIVLDSGPFAGVPLPHASARANSAHIVRSHVATYLITHPHLDHLAGFAINTAAFHATSRPKTLAALPFTVDAIKRHIFNDVIWPNLTDEDGGVGFVTFQRLKEGGDVMVGEGEGRGYIEVCEGLGAKGFKVSHGRCMRNGATESHRGSVGNLSDVPNNYSTTPRHSDARHHSLGHIHLPGTPGSFQSQALAQTSHPFQQDPGVAAVDSTAYFIRDTTTNREILIFGDVEPDSVSVAPRLARVWAEAAHKIAAGILSGIFIECSYPDSQGDAVLFGHFAPRHLIAELQVLADLVRDEKVQRASEKALRKRKRATANGALGSLSQDEYAGQKRTRSLAGRTSVNQLRRSSVPDDMLPEIAGQGLPPSSVPHLSDDMSALENVKTRSQTASQTASQAFSAGTSPGMDPTQVLPSSVYADPLKGVRIMVMHVKDTMKDGPHVGELILQELHDHAAVLAQKGVRLGCDFDITESGQDYWF